MIRQHPEDALLMQHAAGSIGAGPAVVVAVHAEGCGRCRLKLRELEAMGGALLDALEPTPLGADALARTLARLDAIDTPESTPPSSSTVTISRLRASLPAGVAWPRSLRHASASSWRRLSIGVRWCRVNLPDDPHANVFLVRVASGRGLPVHSHRGSEFTQVIYGAFNDGEERFAAGDFEQADGSTHHRPITSRGGECICLTAVDGRMAFDGPLARAMGSLLRI